MCIRDSCILVSSEIQRIHHVCVTLELYTHLAQSLQTLSCTSEMNVEFLFVLGYCIFCRLSRVPKGIVVDIVNCSILINFVFSFVTLDPYRSADLILAGKSSFVIDWTRVHFIPIFTRSAYTFAIRSFGKCDFVHETLISRALILSRILCNKLELLNNCFSSLICASCEQLNS